MKCLLISVSAHNGNAANVQHGKSAEVVGKPVLRAFSPPATAIMTGKYHAMFWMMSILL
jgi:hypothetical protein